MFTAERKLSSSLNGAASAQRKRKRKGCVFCLIHVKVLYELIRALAIVLKSERDRL